MFNKWKKLFEKHETNYMHNSALPYYIELADLQERTDVVHRVADIWFHMIEEADRAGKPIQILPNLSEPIPTREEADRIIDIYDEFTLYEVESHVSYWRDKGVIDTGKPVDEPTRFNELRGMTRQTFAQAIWREIKKQFLEEEKVDEVSTMSKSTS